MKLHSLTQNILPEPRYLKGTMVKTVSSYYSRENKGNSTLKQHRKTAGGGGGEVILYAKAYTKNQNRHCLHKQPQTESSGYCSNDWLSMRNVFKIDIYVQLPFGVTRLV